MTDQTSTIPKGWKMTTLGKVVNFSQGFQISTDDQSLEKKEGYVRFVRIVDYTNDGEIPRYIRNPERCFVNENDLVMIRYGSQTAGKIVRGISGVIANNTFKITPNEDLDNNWLYWFLRQESIYQYLNKDQSSSTMPAITFTQVGNIEIPILSLPEQRAIAAVLSSLDDKIELLREQNKTLEATAQAIFKEWFVNFNFPGATGKMVDSELGEIPEGWRVFPLDQLINIVNGYSYKGDELKEKSRHALVTLKSFDRNGGFQTRGFKPFIGKPKDNQEVFLGDLVVAHTDLTQDAEVLGNPVFIFDNGGYKKIYITMDLVKIISKDKDISLGFFYYLMKDTSFKKHCVSYANGTTVLHLSKKAIPEYKIALPENLLYVKEFSKIAYVSTQKIINNFGQIQTLSKLRDTLLPKLMKGEVRVAGFNN